MGHIHLGKLTSYPSQIPAVQIGFLMPQKMILFAIHTYLERSGVESTTKNLEIFSIHFEEFYLSYWLDAVLWVY